MWQSFSCQQGHQNMACMQRKTTQLRFQLVLWNPGSLQASHDVGLLIWSVSWSVGSSACLRLRYSCHAWAMRLARWLWQAAQEPYALCIGSTWKNLYSLICAFWQRLSSRFFRWSGKLGTLMLSQASSLAAGAGKPKKRLRFSMALPTSLQSPGKVHLPAQQCLPGDHGGSN